MTNLPLPIIPVRLALLHVRNVIGEGGYLVPTRGDSQGAYLKALKSVLMP